MAQSRSSKKLFNMAYGLGASIVILGALFKILHWELGPLNGGLLLAVGLITEAIIFAISAFEPVDDDLDWSLVYPELAGGMGKQEKKESAQGLLSKKLDEMLKGAKIDSELMDSLSDSIRSFEGAAKGMAPTAEAMSSTKKYSEEMASDCTPPSILPKSSLLVVLISACICVNFVIEAINGKPSKL